MPQRRPAISVEPRSDDRWAVRKDGTKRASKVMDRKQDAVDPARQQARREQAQLSSGPAQPHPEQGQSLDEVGGAVQAPLERARLARARRAEANCRRRGPQLSASVEPGLPAVAAW
jgi:hypothetical protein